MADMMLTETSPFKGATSSLEKDGLRVTAIEPGPLLAVQPFSGQQDASGAVLRAALGVGLSGTGRIAVSGRAQVIWWDCATWLAGGQKAALQTANDELLGLAACQWHTGAWAALSVSGPHAQDVLSRLTPLDLRSTVAGRVAQTDVAHMRGAILTREGGYEIWVPRSYARTLAHKTISAAKIVTTRVSRPDVVY